MIEAPKRIKYRKTGLPGRPIVPKSAGIGRHLFDMDTEVLAGSVQGKKASAGEERFARALQSMSVDGYYFRMAVGAERNLPGWKELDFLVIKGGMYYAFEVDTAFTHRNKQNADVLHDAIILNALQSLNLYPQVFHIDGEADLGTQELADQTARSYFA